MKRWLWIFSLILSTLIAGLVVAEDDSTFGIGEWDPSAAEGKSPAERRAMQQAYKARLEEAARDAGWEPGGRRPFTPAGRQVQPSAEKVFGKAKYDSGALGSCCQESFNVGNRFDTANGFPMMMSGSITMATFDMISVSGTMAFLSLFDQLAGSSANFLSSVNKNSLAPGLNIVTWGGMGTINTYVGSSFLMGVWKFASDVPAVATGTVGGQGFHGMSINDIAATQYTSLGTLNAAFGVVGDILTPVELLNFEVD